ncbi:hypothetical protein AB0L40_05235 [Patulibacter sp. NPDC049589]|uniref:hypothetical protein n=1 Tax=Patulibacter sp. NPDC049589 TaxID=3154731 RepID=UPI00343E0936
MADPLTAVRNRAEQPLLPGNHRPRGEGRHGGMSHLPTCTDDYVDHLDFDIEAVEHHGHVDDHGHSHGLVDRLITQSRDGLRTVAISLGVPLVTALAQSRSSR